MLALGGMPRLPLPSALLLLSSSEVGGNAERGVRWCPCQLLPPSQRAGERPLCVPVTCVSLSPPRASRFLPPRCRSGWSWRPTRGCRTLPSPLATSLTCHKPTWSSEVSEEPCWHLAATALAGRSPCSPPQGSWTVTGALGGCWRRSCPPCLSPSLWAPSSTTGRTVSTAASVSSWAEGPQRRAARATVLLREPPCRVAGALAGPCSHAVVPGEPAEGGPGPSWLGDTV